MVQQMCEVVKDYEERLQGMPFVLETSYGSKMLREDDGPNKVFLTFLFCDHDMAIQFLKDMGLLPSTVQCNTCG